MPTFRPAAVLRDHLPNFALEFSRGLLSVVLPAWCFLCGREVAEFTGLGVCGRCWSGLEPWPGPACGRCGLPLAAEHLSDLAAPLCAACRAENPAFDAARVYGLHRGSIRQLILRAKFGQRERIAERLGALLADVWASNSAYREMESPILVPVPLHASRQRERGFNQSLAVARGLRRGLRRTPKMKTVPIRPRVLVRVRPTAPQTGLSLSKRRENVKGVFIVPSRQRVEGRNFVLVDDVMTTGSTVASCAAALKSAGARGVFVLALTRSTPQFPDLEDRAHALDIDAEPHEWT